MNPLVKTDKAISLHQGAIEVTLGVIGEGLEHQTALGIGFYLQPMGTCLKQHHCIPV